MNGNYTVEGYWDALGLMCAALDSSGKANYDQEVVASGYILDYLIERVEVKRKPLSFPEIFGLYALYAYWKGKAYGDSWKKYGEKSSIFPNVARKFDRLTNILINDAPEGGESKVTTVGDLGTYVTLYMTWLSEQCPIEFLSFLKDTRRELFGSNEEECKTKKA